jgi:hypothetical protein
MDRETRVPAVTGHGLAGVEAHSDWISTPSGQVRERRASWPSTAARSASRALEKGTKKESPWASTS